MDMTAKRISLGPAPLNSEGQGTVFNWGVLCLPVRAPVCVRTRTGRRRQVALWFKIIFKIKDATPFFRRIQLGCSLPACESTCLRADTHRQAQTGGFVVENNFQD